MTWQLLLALAGGATVLVAGLTALWKVVTTGSRGVRKVVHAADEVLGVEANGARPAVPGWGARLDALDSAVADIRAQVYPDHGTSMRDRVDGMATSLAELNARFADHIALHASGSTVLPTVVVSRHDSDDN